MIGVGKAIVLPAGTIPRIELSGENLSVEIIGYDGFEVLVKYPDGYQRFHQSHDIINLLDKISGQLRLRYNLDAFDFISVPQRLEISTVKIGGIKYAEL